VCSCLATATFQPFNHLRHQAIAFPSTQLKKLLLSPIVENSPTLSSNWEFDFGFRLIGRPLASIDKSKFQYMRAAREAGEICIWPPAWTWTWLWLCNRKSNSNINKWPKTCNANPKPRNSWKLCKSSVNTQQTTTTKNNNNNTTVTTTANANAFLVFAHCKKCLFAVLLQLQLQLPPADAQWVRNIRLAYINLNIQIYSVSNTPVKINSGSSYDLFI